MVVQHSSNAAIDVFEIQGDSGSISVWHLSVGIVGVDGLVLLGTAILAFPLPRLQSLSGALSGVALPERVVPLGR